MQMDLYYQCGVADSIALLAKAGEKMMPAARKMCEIYNIMEESISARDVIKVILQIPLTIFLCTSQMF